jgi:CheY-like chemotaxis protein
VSAAPLLLLVEDDADVRESLGEVLRDAGYAVAWAANGADALRALRSGLRPAAILLDLMMPGVDGFEFRAAQRGDPAIAAIPVIVLSADRAIDQDARILGAAGHLPKPARVADVLAVVDRVTRWNGGATFS